MIHNSIQAPVPAPIIAPMVTALIVIWLPPVSIEQTLAPGRAKRPGPR
jgi:hypothetical protein